MTNKISYLMTNLPQGWEVKTIDNTCEILNNKRVPISQKNRISGIYPYYGASGIVDYIDKYIFDEELVLIGEDGAKWGAFKNSAFIVNGKYWVNNHAHILKPNNEILINKFLVYFLNYSNLEKYITGATVKKLNQQKLKQIEIPLPPLKEQERIVEILDFAFSKIDENIKKAKENLANIDELMQSVLQKAFNPLNDNTKENYQLPQFWEWKSLGEILYGDKYSIKRGPFGSALKKSFFVENGIRVFEQYNPINNDPHWKRYFISYDKFKELEAFKAMEGDLLISCSGTLGKIVELPKNTEIGVINQALLKIKLDNEKILNSYFIYYFNSPTMQDKILESTLGSAIKNIASVKILKQIQIPLPPLQEQEQIAKHLDFVFEKAKTLKELYTKELKDYEELKQSLLDKAFKGEL
ncbi:TPA: restriction endonuclease subunit S [Campylobacter jejuni]|nr:restriction endonuclease subunit S [Campylobacter jejuni]HEF7701011.1 restriction endonuclease subunit S [Campylobacter jejuni]HEF7707352.1 restriction endonuclease subunit S [Campylobacter jejuni]HEF8756497.1 restriction endonuclease subunit S [Campylobacter jejuni]